MNTCSKRRIPSSRRNSTNLFVIASGLPGTRENFTDETEYATFVWSFLSPPAISQPTPIIPADRYEVVRKALEPPRVDNESDIESTHIMSTIHFDQLDDGTLIKTKSKTEVIAYRDLPDSARTCPEYCDPRCIKVDLADIPDAYQTFAEEEGLNLDYYAQTGFDSDD